MSIDTVLTVYTTALAIIAAVFIGGFTLLYMELHATRRELASDIKAVDKKFDDLRHDLAEEFRAQRAEVAAQISAIANAINAARRP